MWQDVCFRNVTAKVSLSCKNKCLLPTTSFYTCVILLRRFSVMAKEKKDLRYPLDDWKCCENSECLHTCILKLHACEAGRSTFPSKIIFNKESISRIETERLKEKNIFFFRKAISLKIKQINSPQTRERFVCLHSTKF